MAKAEATVEELVSMVERGELRLPEMQRQYVWRSTRVRDLIDSLYRGYPSGAILLWETDETVAQRDFAVSQTANPFQSVRLLLDGQQRLTSLSAVIRGKPVNVRGRKNPIDLLFNLEHPDELAVVTEVDEDGDDAADDDAAEDEADSSDDELMARINRMAFIVATRKIEALATWVRVAEVFDTDSDAPFLKRAGITSFEDPRVTKYSQRLARLRAIRKYTYRMDVLERAFSYAEVTEIFVRVNSLGAKLRSSDLALAQITAKWPGALKIFQDFQAERQKQQGFNLDLGLYLRALMVFATGQSRFLTLYSLASDALKTAWDEAREGMQFALNFAKSNLSIDSAALLSSPFLLIVIAYLGHRRKYTFDAADAALLRRWALIANAKGRFSRGSSESILDQDIASVREDRSIADLIDRLRLQFGRLDISPEELEGRNQRSSLFKTMFLAFRQGGAVDWQSRLAIALDHSGSTHKLQFHHIFPKAVLKGKQSQRKIDDIANLAFISGRTNRKISAAPPAEYIPALGENDSASLASQCIPIDPKNLSLDAYDAFLASRREMVAARLNEFLGTEL